MEPLVSPRERHLKWHALDGLERALMVLCGITLAGFCLSVMCDIVTRTIGHPWLWLQEVTSTLFTYGIFIGTAVATRRNDHLYLTAVAEALHGTSRRVIETFIRLVVIAVGGCMVWFGYLNFINGFSSFRVPSMTPVATLYAAIPMSGALVMLFAVEQLVNGWRNGFENPAEPSEHRIDPLGAPTLKD